MWVSPSRCSSCSSRPTMRAASARELGGELDAGRPTVGQRARTRRGPRKGTGERGERICVAGHRGCGRHGTHGVAWESTHDRESGGDGRLSLLVERNRGEQRGEIGRRACEMDATDHRCDRVGDHRRGVNRLSRRVCDGRVDPGKHRTPHRVGREHEAGGDGAAQRAFAERPGSRLEPRQTRPPLLDRRDDRPAGDAQATGASDDAIADDRGRADTVGDQRLGRDDELLHTRAHLAVRAVEAPGLEPIGRHELGPASLTLLLLTEATERVADRRAEQRARDAVEQDLAGRQRFVARVACRRQQAAALQAHHGDGTHSPVQLRKHVVGHASPPQGSCRNDYSRFLSNRLFLE